MHIIKKKKKKNWASTDAKPEIPVEWNVIA